MKRVIFLSMLLLVAVTAAGSARACTQYGLGDDECRPDSNDILSIDGVGCFVCSPKQCPSGTIVNVVGKSRVKGAGNAGVNRQYQCKAGRAWGTYDDHWSPSQI